MASERPVSEDPRGLELALRITDDAPVDWESTRQSATDLSETLERLRQLQVLGELHRRQPGEAPERPKFVWGPLRAIEKIGEGGFGEVWRAWDPSLAREVALKLRRQDLDPAGASRWLREAQRLARVRHAHVLTVHGTDVHDGRAGIWTDLIRGRTLEDLLQQQGPLGAREIVAIGLDLCAAVAAVHDAGLVHGDIKTRNVMREGAPLGAATAAGAGRIVLMDFGASSPLEPGRDGVGALGATPLYAAPELLDGAVASVASDVYALGTLLYRLASGRYPIEAVTIAELSARHQRGELTPLRTWRPDLPGVLVQAIEKSLAHDPAQRHRGAGEMERALASAFAHTAEAVERPAPLSRQLGLVAAGAALVAVAWAGATWGPEWLRPKFHLVPTGAPATTRLVQSFAGREPNGYLGYSMSAPGDMDGDGLPDLLVAATGENNPNGRVYVMRGTREGTFVPWRTVPGPRGGAFGTRVVALGDVDGDHRPDFAVSASAEDDQGAVHAGAVHLFHGGANPDTVPFLRFGGERAAADYGFDLANAGDVNGDGYGDFLVGAPVDDRDGAVAGRAYLYLGGPGLATRRPVVLHPSNPGGQFGYSVAGIGDINGDGFADFAVGANGDPTMGRGSGKVYVYFGSAHPDSVADLTFYAAGAGDWFGGTIAKLGDLDGDGYDDFAIGAERAMAYESWGGTISIYMGGPTPSTKPRFVLKGKGSNSKFGHRITCGDVDGDGWPDVIAGAYGADDNGPWVGSVVVFRGGPAMDADPDQELVGNSKTGNFGIDLVYVPGLGGAGGRGLAVGAPDAQPGGELDVYAFARYAITRPHPNERWRAGTAAALAWNGAERAEVEWAPAPGTAWRPLAHAAGGHALNTLRITVPAGADSLRVRLRPTDPKVRGEVVSPVVRVERGR